MSVFSSINPWLITCITGVLIWMSITLSVYSLLPKGHLPNTDPDRTHCPLVRTQGRKKKLVQQVICEPVFTEAAHLLHGYCVCEEVGRLSLALQVLGRGHEVFPRVCDLCLRCWIYWMQTVVEMSKRTVYVEEPVRPVSSHLLGVQRARAL